MSKVLENVKAIIYIDCSRVKASLFMRIVRVDVLLVRPFEEFKIMLSLALFSLRI